MELKNRRIDLRIDDPQLAWQLSDLLIKNGVVVHRARDKEELRLFVDRLGVEVVLATVVTEYLEVDRNSICRN